MFLTDVTKLGPLGDLDAPALRSAATYFRLMASYCQQRADELDRSKTRRLLDAAALEHRRLKLYMAIATLARRGLTIDAIATALPQYDRREIKSNFRRALADLRREAGATPTRKKA